MTCPECGKDLVPIGYSIIDIVMGCPDDCSDYEYELMRDGTNEHLVRELKQSWCDCGGVECPHCRAKMSRQA